MSASRLQISEVVVERFGALADLRVVLPDRPFVVLHGHNEAGKSTLSELIAWLLAGPTGDATNARRFGSPRDRIGGRLSGVLRGRPFAAVGRFEVLQRGAPNEAGLTVSFDGTLDAAGWRSILGGLDATVLSAVYRLWGEQLHHGEGVDEHLSRVALAGVAGRVDARELVADLRETTKSLVQARGVDAESILLVNRRIEDLQAEVRDASTSVDEHTRHRRALDEHRDRRVQLDADRARAATLLGAALVVRDASTAESERRALQLELDGIAPVPDAWSELASDPDGADELVRRIETLGDATAESGRELDRVVADVGIPAHRLVELTVTDADLAEAARLTASIERVERHRREASDQFEAAAAELARASAATDRTLASDRTRADRSDAGGDHPLDRGAVERASLDTTAMAHLHRLVDRWDDRTGLAQGQQRAVNVASRDVSEAELRLQLARAAWDRCEAGVPPEVWLREPGHRSAASTRTSVTTRVAVAGAITVLALVALVVGERVSAGVAGALAAVTLLSAAPALRGHGRGHDSSSTTSITDTSTTDTSSTAQAVLDAASRLDELRVVHHRIVGEAQAAEVAAAEATEAARAAFTARCLPPPADPDHGRRLLVAWEQATAALAHEQDCSDAVAARQVSRQHADDELDALRADVRALLGRWGASTASPPRELDEFAARVRAATGVARRHHQEQADLDAVRAAFDRLIAPVAAEIEGWRNQRLIDHVRELAARLDRRHHIERQIRDLERELTVRVGGSAEVQDLLARSLQPAEIDAIVAERERAVAEIDEQLQRCSEVIGGLEQELSRLERVERIAELELCLGSAHEHLDELVVEMAAHAVAAGLLHHVAEEYERAHQPQIVARAAELARSVAPEWDDIVVRPTGPQRPLEVIVRQRDGQEVTAPRLSTGARALLYLAFRVSLAEHDAERRGVRLPVLCDDPLVHLDDQRAREVVPVLAAAADAGHQVLLFTCHERTVAAAVAAGAAVVQLQRGRADAA